jgi:hypothetical protein
MNVDIVEPQTMCDLRSPRIATDYYTVLMRREQSGRAASSRAMTIPVNIRGAWCLHLPHP